MSFKPIDPRRDEYRKYLERTGVVDSLSKVILELYQTPDPKPENAVEFIRKKLGDNMLESDTIDHLKRELEDSQNVVANLERQLEALKVEMAKKQSQPSIDVVKDTPAAEVQDSEIPIKDDTEQMIENDEKAANEENPVTEVEPEIEAKSTEVMENDNQNEGEIDNETEVNGKDEFKEVVNGEDDFKEAINDESMENVEQKDESTEEIGETNEEIPEKKDTSEAAENESTAPA